MGGERPWRPLASSGIQGKHIPQEGPRCSQLPLGNGGFGGLEGSDSVGVCPCCGRLAPLPLCRWGLGSSTRPRWSAPGFSTSALLTFGPDNSLSWGAVLCHRIPVLTHYMPQATSHNQKYLQMSSHILGKGEQSHSPLVEKL